MNSERERALLLRDPDWRVRLRALGGPGRDPLPDEVLTRLLADADDPGPDVPFTRDELLAEVLESTRFERRVMLLAAGHPRPGVRRHMAQYLRVLPDDVRRALTADPDPGVRQAVADMVAWEQQVMTPADLPAHHCHAFWLTLSRRLSRELVDLVTAGDDVEAIAVVAANPTTPPDVVAGLFDHPAPEVRCGLAERADLTADQLSRLTTDPAPEVRIAAARR